MADPQQGMFGNQAGYKATTNPFQFANQTYDLSGVQAGANKLKENQYQGQQYNAPKLQNFQLGNPGAYGTSSPQQMHDLYANMFNVGSKPVMAQGAEANRQVGQGFGGGGIGSAARQKLVERNAQNTGGNLADMGKSFGSQLGQAQLGEQQLARSQDYATKYDQLKTNFNQNVSNQLNQTGLDFQGAQFGDQQSRYKSEDTMNRAMAMMNTGMQLPQLQAGLNQAGMFPYYQYLQGVSSAGMPKA